MKEYFCEKTFSIIGEIVAKSLISVILIIIINALKGEKTMSSDSMSYIFSFITFYMLITWIYVAARFFSNWILGIIGALIALVAVAFLMDWATKQDGAIEIIVLILVAIITFGLFFVDIIRVILSIMKTRKFSKMEEQLQQGDVISGQNVNPDDKDVEIHLTGDYTVDTDFLINLKNSGYISEERFQKELRELVAKK